MIRLKTVALRVEAKQPHKSEREVQFDSRGGYSITRAGDDVTVYHDDFGDTVMVIPWASVAWCHVSQDEMTKPVDAKKR